MSYTLLCRVKSAELHAHLRGSDPTPRRRFANLRHLDTPNSRRRHVRDPTQPFTLRRGGDRQYNVQFGTARLSARRSIQIVLTRKLTLERHVMQVLLLRCKGH